MKAVLINQLDQLKNPDCRIVIGEGQSGPLLSRYADSFWGLGSGDYPRFGRAFWEIRLPDRDWIYQLSTIAETRDYGARERVLYWQEGRGEIVNSPGAFVRGTRVWGSSGVHVSQIRELRTTVYTGECWDSNSAPIVPRDPAHLPAIWCFCKSPEFSKAVRAIDQKLNVTNATLVKVPFDLDHWRKVAEEEYPKGLPEPYSDDPTQWVFHGHPCGSVIWDEQTKSTAHGPKRVDDTVLQVAAARLLGYRWPAELDPDMRLCPRQREWVERAKELDSLSDPDGIVCLPALHGERSAADRLRALLAAAYGDRWSFGVEESLLAAVGFRDKDLDVWLRDAFFEQHCRLFHQRPFIWHIWDGRKDGFSALVNYHKLDRAKLDKLAYTYLGDWIKRQTQGAQSGAPGAEQRLGAAQELQKKLRPIADGESPYDIYVRWKPLHEQPIGWEPDLNDGVRLNIRPFVTAGVLRWKPNINWKKDRGKNPDGSDRLNDIHLTLEQKRKAREDEGLERAAG